MDKLRNFTIACFCAIAVFNVDASAVSMFDRDRNQSAETSPVVIPAPTPVILFGTSEPYRTQVQVDIPDFYSTKSKEFQAIPAGKRFVVEHVSVRGYVQAGQKPMVWLKLGSFEYALVAHHQVSFSNGKDYFAASQPMKLHVDSSDSLYAFASRWSNSGISEFTFTLSGYLIDGQ